MACDTHKTVVRNGEEFSKQKRIVNCALSEVLLPGFADFRFSVLPIGLNDVSCDCYPCVPTARMAHGYGRGETRALGSESKSFSGFIHPVTLQEFDLTVYPEIRTVEPHISGILGGTEVDLHGTSFSPYLAQNNVTVAGIECHVEVVSATHIRCTLPPVRDKSVLSDCFKFEVYVGVQPEGNKKVVQHEASTHVVFNCTSVGQRSAGLSTQFALQVGEPTVGFYWAEDVCAKWSKQRRGKFEAKEAKHSLVCCTLDGLGCVGKPGDQCIEASTWDQANKTCADLGHRLCTKQEILREVCCFNPCGYDGNYAWTSTQGTVQELQVESFDGLPWDKDLWLLCYDSASCDAESGGDFLQGPFLGGRGVSYKVYRNGYDLSLDDVFTGANDFFPQSPIRDGTRTDFVGGGFNHLQSKTLDPDSADAVERLQYFDTGPWTADTGHDSYVEEILGLFTPPFTANYSFYVAADQTASVALSRHMESLHSKAAVIARAVQAPVTLNPRLSPISWYTGPCVVNGRLQRVGHDCSISAPLMLTANHSQYLKVRHKAFVPGNDFVRVGLRIHKPFHSVGKVTPQVYSLKQSFFEVQKLTLSIEKVYERHAIILEQAWFGRWVLDVSSEGRTKSIPQQWISVSAVELAYEIWRLNILVCRPEVQKVWINSEDHGDPN
jgi:hypothetical protein